MNNSSGGIVFVKWNYSFKPGSMGYSPIPDLRSPISLLPCFAWLVSLAGKLGKIK
jgi:hypothetical protein